MASPVSQEDLTHGREIVHSDDRAASRLAGSLSLRGMTFPPSGRVLYRSNPLVEVICQLRFPPILRIDASEPTEFQEAVRGEYPLYTEVETGIPQGLPEPLQAIMRGKPGAVKSVKKFLSADERWTIALTRDFVALLTNRYERWEEFRARLRMAVDALQGVYRPAFYTRLGLRYRDVICRAQLGLDGVPWSALLNTYISGELASDVAASIRKASREALIELAEYQGKVLLKHGLTDPTAGSKEPNYLIDADFFTAHRTELNDVDTRLDYFNHQAGRLFRWCITEQLHESMGPQPFGGHPG